MSILWVSIMPFPNYPNALPWTHELSSHSSMNEDNTWIAFPKAGLAGLIAQRKGPANH